MKPNKIGVLLWTAVSFLLANCATIVSTNEYAVRVTAEPSGAVVLIDNKVIGEAPQLITLKSDKTSYAITVEKPGYEPETQYLQRSVDNWLFGNLLFGGVIGFIVDHSNGSGYQFPTDPLHFSLRPGTGLPPTPPVVMAFHDGASVVVVHRQFRGYDAGLAAEVKRAYNNLFEQKTQIPVTDISQNPNFNTEACDGADCLPLVKNVDENATHLIINTWNNFDGNYVIRSEIWSLTDNSRLASETLAADSFSSVISNNMEDLVSRNQRTFATARTAVPTSPGQGTTTPAQREDEIRFGRQGDGFGLNIQGDVSEEQAIRNAWQERGGSITGREFGLGLAILYSDIDISGPGISGYTEISGVGGNIKFGLHNINLRPPNYENNRLSNFWASKIGIDFEYSIFSTEVYSFISMDGFGSTTSSFSSTQHQLNFVGNLGAFYGLGTSMISPLGWRGVELGFNYRPTLMIVIPEEGDADTNFNATGFSLDFSFGRELNTSLERIAPQPFRRLSLFFLPPIGDDGFFFMSINYARLLY